MRLFRTATALPILLMSFAAPLAVAPQPAEAQVTVGVSITVPPPALPVYVQPVIPAEGYIWTPGYWAWGPYGYYWVPGTWVLPPAAGLLWTPGYWAWENAVYIWHPGYWGERVGFYGGINYGFGYFGTGFVGGFWERGHFHYNRTINNFGSVHITNVYSRTVYNNTNVTRVSFNGGRGGTNARPTAQQQAFARGSHIGPSNLQVQHEETARNDRAMLSSVNHGRPTIAATPRPAAFQDRGAVRARGAETAPRGNPPAPAAATVRPPDQPRPDQRGPGRRDVEPTVQRPPQAPSRAAPSPAVAPQGQPRPDQQRHERGPAQPAAQRPPQAPPGAAPAPRTAAPQAQAPRPQGQGHREGDRGGEPQRGPDRGDDQPRGGGGGGGGRDHDQR